MVSPLFTVYVPESSISSTEILFFSTCFFVCLSALFLEAKAVRFLITSSASICFTFKSCLTESVQVPSAVLSDSLVSSDAPCNEHTHAIKAVALDYINILFFANEKTPFHIKLNNDIYAINILLKNYQRRYTYILVYYITITSKTLLKLNKQTT